MQARVVGLVGVLVVALLGGGAAREVHAEDDLLEAEVKALQMPRESQQAIAEAALRLACRLRGDPEFCVLKQLSSESLGTGLVHSVAVIQVGPTSLDVIRVHRIVRHGGPRAETAEFFVHGSAGNFTSAFLVTGHGRWLAENRVDVWGIDLRHANVPEATTDFTPMATWNFDAYIGDIMLGTKFARIMRVMSGQGPGRVQLAGWSLGASLAIAVANAEAALPPHERDVASLMPIDTIYKVDPADTAGKALVCGQAVGHRSVVAAGTYFIDRRPVTVATRRAVSDPLGTSPAAGLNNTQYALRLAGSLSFPPAYPFHMAAVTYADGKPAHGTFTPNAMIFAVQIAGNYVNTRPGIVDYFTIPCEDVDTSHDDNLAEIDIPVLLVGAAGGFGTGHFYVGQLMPEADVETLYVQRLPHGQGNFDFGHMEFFSATEAPTLVWQPMLDWLKENARRCRQRGA